MDKSELVEEAQELLDNLNDVCERLARLQRELEGSPETRQLAARMHAYLQPALEMAAAEGHQWLGSNPCTLQSVVDELNADESEDEE